MAIHTTDAIVLRHYRYRETSALVSCMTDRYGKIKGLIKGLRGPAGKHRSAMEPLTLNRIVFYDTRTSPLHLITQCELLSGFVELTQELETMRFAASCGELVDVLTETNEPQPAIFTLLRDTLERLSASMHALLPVRIHFILRLLRLVGFQPQLDQCVACGRPAQGQRAFWSVRQGGLMCEGCLHQDPRAHPIAPEFLAAMSRCAEADEPQALEPAQAQALHRKVDEFLRWRVDRPLKAMGAPGNGQLSHATAAWRRQRTPAIPGAA